MSFRANNELAVHVPDPATAETFYTRVLGCVVMDRTPDCISLTSVYVRDPHGILFDVIERGPARAPAP
jgi:hypothetical protein